MKTSYLFLLLFVVLLGSSFTTNPIKATKLISNSSLEVKIGNSKNANLLESAQFLKHENSIAFITKYKIEFIKIYDSNDVLKYQLPVMSSKVRISKSMFQKGKYKVSFLFKETKQELNSYILIK